MPQADERSVDRHQVDRALEGRGVEGAGVGALERDHAGVFAQPLVQLPVADVDRVNAPGAGLQEAVGEAPGRGADVDRLRAPGVEAVGGEGLERAGELEPAARDVRVRIAPQRERRLARNEGAGLVDPHFAQVNAPRDQQGLGPGAARREALFDQENIGSFALRLAHRLRALAGAQALDAARARAPRQGPR